MHTKNDESIKVSPSLAIKIFHQFLEKKINKKKTLRPKTRKNQFSLLGSQKSITWLILHKLKNLNTAIFLHKDCRPMSVGWDPQERQPDRQQKQLGSGAVGHLTYTFCPVIISVEIKRHYIQRWDPFHIGRAVKLPRTYHCFFFYLFAPRKEFISYCHGQNKSAAPPACPFCCSSHISRLLLSC